ncbi:hypothetical protein TrRE_jg1161, partial [Triparma retinervis]
MPKKGQNDKNELKTRDAYYNNSSRTPPRTAFTRAAFNTPLNSPADSMYDNSLYYDSTEELSPVKGAVKGRGGRGGDITGSKVAGGNGGEGQGHQRSTSTFIHTFFKPSHDSTDPPFNPASNASIPSPSFSPRPLLLLLWWLPLLLYLSLLVLNPTKIRSIIHPDAPSPQNPPSPLAPPNHPTLSENLLRCITPSIPPPLNARFSYIIIGGGPAGLTLATTLSKSLPLSSVLLLEAGPYECPDCDVPIMWGDRSWEGGLGGMGMVNAMVYVEGGRGDGKEWDVEGWGLEREEYNRIKEPKGPIRVTGGGGG